MNRRGFFGALLALPAAVKALAAAKPRPEVLHYDGKPWQWARGDSYQYEWKSLHAPIIYCGEDSKYVGMMLDLYKPKATGAVITGITT